MEGMIDRHNPAEALDVPCRRAAAWLLAYFGRYAKGVIGRKSKMIYLQAIVDGRVPPNVMPVLISMPTELAVDEIAEYLNTIWKKEFLPFTPETARNFPIAVLDLDVRSYNTFTRADYTTLDDLMNAGRAELMSIPNFGPVLLGRVIEKLRMWKLELQ